MDIIWRLFSIFSLIAINAFFVTLEFAIVSVRRSRINQLVEEQSKPALMVQTLHRRIEQLLSTTQIGITLSSLALGWIGEDTLASLIKDFFITLPSELTHYVSPHAIAIPIAFSLLAYLQIVLGELCPKSLALLYSEQLALALAGLGLAIARLFKPFIWLLNHSTHQLLTLIGVEYSKFPFHRFSSKELLMLLNTEGSTGLDPTKRALVKNVLEFGELVAADIMVPRTGIITIGIDATIETVVTQSIKTGFSRYPVIGESLDDIRGILDFQDLAYAIAHHPDNIANIEIKPWIRNAKFVPELTPLTELLLMIRGSCSLPKHNINHSPPPDRSYYKQQEGVLIVVDEFGQTVGLITLNDLMTKLIGDKNELPFYGFSKIQKLNDQTYMIHAQMNLERLNDILHLDLPLRDEYQTLGGFLLYQFQRMPNNGETITYQNLELTLISSRGPRLNQIQIFIKEPKPKSYEDSKKN